MARTMIGFTALCAMGLAATNAPASQPAGEAPGERNLIMGTGEPRDPQPFTREQRLLDAVRRGDRATVERALELGVSVEAADDLQRSALLLAARDAQDADLVRFLHERGGVIDRADRSGRSPLSYAASSGQLGLVEYLAENGAEIDRADRRGRSPLFHAVMGDRAEIVSWLLDRGAEIDRRDRYGDTALIMACSKGHGEIAWLLVARGADRSLRNDQGRSAGDRAAPGLDVCREIAPS